MKLAYITVSFPSNTETFVLREVNFLEKIDMFEKLIVFAYKKPDKARINEDNRRWMHQVIYTRQRLLFNLFALFYFILHDSKKVFWVMRMWIKETWNLSLKENIKVMAHIFTAFGVARNIRKEKIEHMHAHFSTASTIALIAHMLTGVSFSFTAHASGDIYVYSPFLFEKIKRAKRIIAVSEYNRKYLELICNYDIDTSKINIIYNGVNIPEIADNNTKGKVPMIFMSAAYTGFKGYGTLIHALELLKEKRFPFVFYSVGDGPLFSKIKDMVAKKGLKEDVKLLSWQPISVVKEYLKKADIFVFPSEIYINGARDGMPTAITEAMSYGLPIVATYMTGIPEQVRDGYNGFLVPERSAQELAVKLEKLLLNKELRDQMGARSYEIAKNKFDLDVSMGRLMGIFNDLKCSE